MSNRSEIWLLRADYRVRWKWPSPGLDSNIRSIGRNLALNLYTTLVILPIDQHFRPHFDVTIECCVHHQDKLASSVTKTPVSTETGGGGSAPGSNSHITAIIVGVVLGALALVVASIVALVIIRRRCSRNGRFHMLYPSEDDENPHAAAAIPVAQSATTQHRIPLFGFGVIGSRISPRRRNMLADEDTRHFNDRGIGQADGDF